jgi:Flp pilus assembly protein CpaB
VTWTNPLNSLRRALRWHRRLLAAVLVGLAVYFALAALTERADTTRVVVAAHTIASGGTVSAGDLTTLELPRFAIPEGALTDAGQAVGQTLVSPVPARAVLTTSALASGDSLVAPGRVALPVGLSDSAPLGLLQVGDRIDLLGPGDSGSIEVLVSSTRVITLPQIDAGLFGGGSPVILVDVSRTEATRLVAAGAPLNFALS